ncbi:hypothetical protein FACS189449_03110 [Alphaproteobacteria bacterium]|nr:hypothetical protein FACS189449_03110 [Alphaproteobacteria bacterium]
MRKLAIGSAVAILFAFIIDILDAKGGWHGNSTTEVILKRSWKNHRESFRELETSLKNLKMLVKRLHTAYMNASESFDPLSQWGTSGNGEFNAFLYYLDKAITAANAISQSERDDVLVEKILKAIDPMPAVAAYNCALNARDELSADGRTSNSAKFMEVLATFCSSIASLRLPRLKSKQSRTPVAAYTAQYIEGLEKFKRHVAETRKKKKR